MPEQESRTITRVDWMVIALLVALVLPLRLWLIHNTEVTARDSIGYIRYALQFERLPWHKVWKDNHQHPGYPMAVYLMSMPVRAADDGETTAENMELSTQLVNLFASLLLIVPMYLLGRQFFDRTNSFGAVLLYQYLPVSAQHLSDGISEPIFLVLLLGGLLMMVRAVRDQSVGSSIACGVFAGLAYLVRPEGLLIVPAFGAALLAVQFRAEWRFSWRGFLACGFAMLTAAVLVGAVYVYATGRITNKLSAIEVLVNLLNLVLKMLGKETVDLGAAPLFAVTFVPGDTKWIRLGQGSWAFIRELIQGLHYAGIVPAVLGLWWSFAGLRRQAGFWALAIYAAIHSFILIALAMSVSYVSDRHVMILVIFGSFFVVVGLRELPSRVFAWLKSESLEAPWYRSANVWFAILFVVLFAICLPRATQRLHGMRVGNHEAGLWLKDKVRPMDVVEDDHAWSHFFTGMLFTEGNEPIVGPEERPRHFIVTTRARDGSEDPKRVSPNLTKDAKAIYTWPEETTPNRARIVIYEQPRVFATHPWRTK